jgi:hypothetical protein
VEPVGQFDLVLYPERARLLTPGGQIDRRDARRKVGRANQDEKRGKLGNEIAHRKLVAPPPPPAEELCL